MRCAKTHSQLIRRRPLERYAASGMYLSGQDLRELDDEYLHPLSPVRLRRVWFKPASDLKEMQERLSQNPCIGFRAPSTRAPWEIEGSSGEIDADGDGESREGDHRGR